MFEKFHEEELHLALKDQGQHLPVGHKTGSEEVWGDEESSISNGTDSKYLPPSSPGLQGQGMLGMLIGWSRCMLGMPCGGGSAGMHVGCL